MSIMRQQMTGEAHRLFAMVAQLKVLFDLVQDPERGDFTAGLDAASTINAVARGPHQGFDGEAYCGPILFSVSAILRSADDFFEVLERMKDTCEKAVHDARWREFERQEQERRERERAMMEAAALPALKPKRLARGAA